MKHNLMISINRPPTEVGIVRCKTIGVRQRLLNKLFGKKQKLTLIVPGDSVECISIRETEEGDELCQE
jgi:hypothetical protein